MVYYNQMHVKTRLSQPILSKIVAQNLQKSDADEAKHSHHNTTKILPGACHRKMQQKSSVQSTHSNGLNQKQIIDFIQTINNRVNKLEQLTIKIDLTLATTDIEMLDIQSNLTNAKK